MLIAQESRLLQRLIMVDSEHAGIQRRVKYQAPDSPDRKIALAYALMSCTPGIRANFEVDTLTDTPSIFDCRHSIGNAIDVLNSVSKSKCILRRLPEIVGVDLQESPRVLLQTDTVLIAVPRP